MACACWEPINNLLHKRPRFFGFFYTLLAYGMLERSVFDKASRAAASSKMTGFAELQSRQSPLMPGRSTGDTGLIDLQAVAVPELQGGGLTWNVVHALGRGTVYTVMSGGSA